MADNVINIDNIRNYLTGHGGKARNSDVVLHFKEYLNYPDPKKKEHYRQKFKECINVVAIKKDENGTKYIVLKKKFRDGDTESSPRQWRIGHPHQYEQGPLEISPSRSDEERRSAETRWREQISQREEEKRHAESLRQAAKRERERRQEEERKTEEKRERLLEEERLKNERIQEGLRIQEEQRAQRERELFEKRTREEFEKSTVVAVGPSEDEPDRTLDNNYSGPAEQTDVLRLKEGERVIEEKSQILSVTEQVQMIDSSFETEKTPKKGSQQNSMDSSKDGDSVVNKGTLSSSGSHASIRSNVFIEKERLWILYSAQNDLANLSLLASESKDLIHSRDFINGWTAMHWGAKHGRKEMIRLVANFGVDINLRSHAGYTPLHIAAIHNREAIMQFLTTEYQADVNIRDYSGKRPHQYLPSTEPAYLQQNFQDPFSGVLPNIKVGHLEKFEAQGKRSSKFGSLRASFRALRTWGSTESIPKKRTISSGGVFNSSPKMRPKSLHVEHHRSFTPETSPKLRQRPLSTVDADRNLMPPPAPPDIMQNKTGKQQADFHKSGSDSNIRATSTSTYI